MQKPSEQQEGHTFDSLVRGIIGYGLLAFVLLAVISFIPRGDTSAARMRLSVAECVILAAPDHPGAVATWAGGSAALPITFRHPSPPPGSYHFRVKESVKVKDASGRDLETCGSMPVGLRALPHPPTRWYEFLKRREQRRQALGEYYVVLWYDDVSPPRQSRVQTLTPGPLGTVIPMPADFIVARDPDPTIDKLAHELARQRGLE